MAKLGNCSMIQGNVNDHDCCVSDQVCLTVELEENADETQFEFYRNDSGFDVNVTIVITNNESSDDVGAVIELIVNGNDPDDGTFTINPGDTRSFTLSNVLSLAIEIETSSNIETTADIQFSVNYKF